MKILAFLLAVVLIAPATAARTAQAAKPVAHVPELAAWNIAELDDVTQGWYFTGEALADQQRDGAPWAADHMALRTAVQLAETPAPAPVVVPAPAVADVPTLPEPSMISMLLVGLVLIFLSVGGERHETFNS